MPVDFLVQFTKTLGNLSRILDKAQAYAEAKKFEPSVLLNARLAPDQFNFTRQIQITCDTAKGFAAKLSGQEPPKHEDNETTIPQLKERIQKTQQYLEAFQTKDFEGWETRKIYNPRYEGKSITGKEFLFQHGTPNFFFHVTTAYSILRHNGLEIGKKDYLGEINWR